MGKYKTKDDTQFMIAREYFFGKSTLKDVGRKHGVEESSARRFYIRWLKGIYRDFICGLSQEMLEIRYDMDASSLYRCLKEAERCLHIGVCFSKVGMEGGELYMK